MPRYETLPPNNFLGLDEQHFNRVIHRARERFRALLEGHGLKRNDFLCLAALLVG